MHIFQLQTYESEVEMILIYQTQLGSSVHIHDYDKCKKTGIKNTKINCHGQRDRIKKHEGSCLVLCDER